MTHLLHCKSVSPNHRRQTGLLSHYKHVHRSHNPESLSEGSQWLYRFCKRQFLMPRTVKKQKQKQNKTVGSVGLSHNLNFPFHGMLSAFRERPILSYVVNLYFIIHIKTIQMPFTLIMRVFSQKKRFKTVHLVEN